jgi:hypothetical protein
MNDQSIRHAIEKHGLLTLARILDNKISHSIRKEIEAKGMRALKKAKKYIM